MFWRCNNGMDFPYHCATFGGARTVYAARGEKVQRFLFVCLSVTLLNDIVCERHFANKALEFGNVLGVVG